MSRGPGCRPCGHVKLWHGVVNGVGRHRAATISLGDYGNSIGHSACDALCCQAGFMLARRQRHRAEHRAERLDDICMHCA